MQTMHRVQSPKAATNITYCLDSICNRVMCYTEVQAVEQCCWIRYIMCVLCHIGWYMHAPFHHHHHHVTSPSPIRSRSTHTHIRTYPWRHTHTRICIHPVPWRHARIRTHPWRHTHTHTHTHSGEFCRWGWSTWRAGRCGWWHFCQLGCLSLWWEYALWDDLLLHLCHWVAYRGREDKYITVAVGCGNKCPQTDPTALRCSHTKLKHVPQVGPTIMTYNFFMDPHWSFTYTSIAVAAYSHEL